MQANSTAFPTSKLRVLRIDASARAEGSVSRQLADLMFGELDERMPGLMVVRRDLLALHERPREVEKKMEFLKKIIF